MFNEAIVSSKMLTSPTFNLQLISAFAQEPSKKPIQDDEKLKFINDIAKSLGITESIVVVPAADIMSMIQIIRNYQQQLARI